MKQHSFLAHTPEEMRQLSNLGHVLEGILFAIVGLIVLLEKLGSFTWASSAWPILILVSGILLLFLLYPLHPVAEWHLIWRDAQQREHTIIAFAALIAGAAELLQSTMPVLTYVWPAALMLIGGLFFFHAQHGTSEAAVKALWQHRALGITLIVAGLLRLIEISRGAELAGILWPLTLLIAAAQLLLYREPEGAYEGELTHMGHGGC